MSKIIAFDRSRRDRTVHHTPRVRSEGGGTASQNTAGAERRTCAGRMREGSVQVAVSVVVPTGARPELLNRGLASLALQLFNPARFEIIVVDDDPSEETRDVVAGWARHCADTGPRITYIPSMGRHGPAAARNLGWRAARGEIIAFIDDDAVARADWLRNGIRAFEHDVDAVWGRILTPLCGTPTEYELEAKKQETAEFVAANCFCRKSVLEEVGGFDERFRIAWREDADLHFRLIQYCAGIVHESNAVVMHPVRPARWGVSLMQTKKAQFDVLLYKKHPTLFRSKIHTALRWDFYIALGALLIAIAAGLLDIAPLVLIAGAAWLGATCHFCFQRLRTTSKAPHHIAEMVVTSALIPPLAVFWRLVGMLKFRAGLL